MSVVVDGRTYLKLKLRGKKAFLSKEEKWFFVLMFLIVIFKFGYFGYSYVPFLDDYVQYGLYPNFDNIADKVFFGGAKTVYTRPLATFIDVYVIGRLGLGGLGIAMFVITVLYAVSAILFYVSFKAVNLHPTVMFPTIYALAPITIEGTYWVSASSRIVVSMFFISLFIYFALRFKGECGFYETVVIWLCNALSYAFYEQTAVLSFMLCIYFAVKIKDKKLLIIGTLNFTILVVYYLMFSSKGDNAERVAIKSIAEIVLTLPKVGTEILQLWFKEAVKLNLVGFKRGFEVLASNNSFLWLIVMSVLVISIFRAMNKIKFIKPQLKQTKNHKKLLVIYKNEKLILGIILFIVPYFPFFLTGNLWINFRNANASILGFAFVFEDIVEKIFKSNESKSFLASILIIFFLIITVSEINDYMNITRSDLAIVKNVADSIDSDTKKVTVTLKKADYSDQNVPFRDHILSITNSYYGITGAVRALSGNYDVVAECKFINENIEQ